MPPDRDDSINTGGKLTSTVLLFDKNIINLLLR